MKNNIRGFTLIEIMIVVAIVGIIASIALPSYRDSVTRTNRNVAKADLMELQQWMERNYTLTNRYDQLPDATTITIDSLPRKISPRSGTKKYDITFLSGPSQTAYTLKATPTSSQSDAACGFLAVSSASVRSVGGTSSISDCWNR